jgi:hypothetical protein
MMMAWKYYSTIIQIWVADEGESGEELVGWGVTLAGRNGCNQTITADKKSWRIGGGHNNHQLHRHCRRFVLFSPYSNYHTFKYI